MIDAAILVACGVGPVQAATFAPLLDVALRQWGIDTRRRQAAFIAQAVHESAGFTRLREGLHYTSAERIMQVWPSRFRSIADARAYVGQPAALANRVYANRLGNGAEWTGDGAKFAGRGIIQLTGRANYRAAGAALKMPYEAQPDLVAEPPDAVITACWFWTRAGCNEMADAGDHSGMCRAINGPALAGLRERTALYRRCFEALA